ncbi:MAG: cupin domain-containing protein [Burkholderiales bacterium]|nr:cupin domain-containing protein [Burkholderiales bacterium]
MGNNDTAAAIAAAGNLDELYPTLAAARFTAGWHKKRPSLWAQPTSEYRPMHWRYAHGRLALDRAAEWIDTELAERRNLVMYNPVGDNDYATARTIICAYQMIRPGEYAKSHRHTPNALRLMLDGGPGVYTVVNGVKLPMIAGDVLLTPNWCWHSHYNEGVENGYWIDYLDVPLVHLLEPMFFEQDHARPQPVTEEPKAHEFWFPYARTQAQLADAAPDANGVRTLTLSTPAFKTIELRFHRVPAGGSTRRRRTTASGVFAITEGEGSTRAGAERFDWTRGDVFVVPSWTPFEISAARDATLFECTDALLLRTLDLLRERDD